MPGRGRVASQRRPRGRGVRGAPRASATAARGISYVLTDLDRLSDEGSEYDPAQDRSMSDCSDELLNDDDDDRELQHPSLLLHRKIRKFLYIIVVVDFLHVVVTFL